MSVSNSSSSGGVGFVGLLTIAFIILKLTGVISWSWWWVLAPAWGGLAVGIGAFIVVVVVIAGVKTLARVMK